MNITSGSTLLGEPPWGRNDHKFNVEGYESLLAGMVAQNIGYHNVYCPLGKGGAGKMIMTYSRQIRQSVCKRKRVIDSSFVLLLLQLVALAEAQQHVGRKQLKYNPKITCNGFKYNELLQENG